MFVYGVHSSCPKSVIEDEFARVGKVLDIYVTTKGYAFVTFDTLDDAQEAIREVGQGRQDRGRRHRSRSSFSLIPAGWLQHRRAGGQGGAGALLQGGRRQARQGRQGQRPQR